MSEEIKSSENAQDHAQNIATGSGVIIVALFGLCRQLGYMVGWHWADAIIAAIGVSIAVGCVLRNSALAAIGALSVAGGLIAFRHDLIEVNVKVLFFVVLFIVGMSMVFRGMRQSD